MERGRPWPDAGASFSSTSLSLADVASTLLLEVMLSIMSFIFDWDLRSRGSFLSFFGTDAFFVFSFLALGFLLPCDDVPVAASDPEYFFALDFDAMRTLHSLDTWGGWLRLNRLFPFAPATWLGARCCCADAASCTICIACGTGGAPPAMFLSIHRPNDICSSGFAPSSNSPGRAREFALILCTSRLSAELPLALSLRTAIFCCWL
mmetsp:Transcript_327/g.632  ORF Transcript_327/g.632 Transcript_327/m.632 type:complete len:206 (+) Transcript_327:494-1111(+)